jgi:MFS family permease
MRLFLLLTAVVAGALVMTLEVVGARVIGAFYGVSLFVWTSLIAVTLLALAAGYVAGGRYADRMRGPGAIFVWLAAAGACVLAVPWLKAAVLVAAAPLGPRWGAFACAFVLFGPALALLGAVSPAIVRQLAGDPQRLGATVGGLFGWSTLGSLAGTLLAGYVLLVHFSLTGILVACAAAALALAAAYFLLYQRRAWGVLLLMPPFAALPGGADIEAALADGTRARVVEARAGFYGELRVVEYSYGELRVRELLIDGLVQGAADAATLQSTYETVYLLQALPLAHRPGGTRALVAGLGPGTGAEVAARARHSYPGGGDRSCGARAGAAPLRPARGIAGGARGCTPLLRLGSRPIRLHHPRRLQRRHHAVPSREPRGAGLGEGAACPARRSGGEPGRFRRRRKRRAGARDARADVRCGADLSAARARQPAGESDRDRGRGAARRAAA